jgi:V-type H+-transporting ATPase subunit C
MVYWIVSLPISGGRRDRTWELLQERTTAGQQLSTNYKLEVPELRVGTLDTLMALSDDLNKVNTVMDNTVNKIRRTISDMSGPEALSGLKVDNVPAQQFLTRFKWDEPKYPSRRPLKETVDKILEIMTHMDDDLKVRMARCT